MRTVVFLSKNLSAINQALILLIRRSVLVPIQYLSQNLHLLGQHLSRSFKPDSNLQPKLRFFSSHQELLSQLRQPDLAGFSYLVLSAAPEPDFTMSPVLGPKATYLRIAHLDLIPKFIESISQQNKGFNRGCKLAIIIDHPGYIPCAFELNKPLWDKQINYMRSKIITNLYYILNNLINKYNIYVLVLDKSAAY